MGVHLTRIENRAGTGCPDVYMAFEGHMFWVELKVAKGNAIDMRPSQIAWNMAHSAAGGVSFILVNRPSKGDAFLFEGSQALELADRGVLAGHLWHGLRLADCFEVILAACGSRSEVQDS